MDCMHHAHYFSDKTAETSLNEKTYGALSAEARMGQVCALTTQVIGADACATLVSGVCALTGDTGACSCK